MARNPPVRDAAPGEQGELCSCGHFHARGKRCGAIVSGTPMLQYCECPSCTPNGEHIRPAGE